MTSNHPYHLEQRLFVVVREVGSRELSDHDVVDDQEDPVGHPHGDRSLVGDGQQVRCHEHLLRDPISQILKMQNKMFTPGFQQRSRQTDGRRQLFQRGVGCF